MPRCPKCGSTKVRKVEDKTKIVAVIGHTPRYKTYYICGNCTYQWDPEEQKSTE